MSEHKSKPQQEITTKIVVGAGKSKLWSARMKLAVLFILSIVVVCLVGVMMTKLMNHSASPSRSKVEGGSAIDKPTPKPVTPTYNTYVPKDGLSPT